VSWIWIASTRVKPACASNSSSPWSLYFACMIDHKKYLENTRAAVFPPTEQTLRYDELHVKYVLLKFRPLGKVSLCVRTNTRRGRYSMGKLDANALRRGGARCARESASVQKKLTPT